MVSFSELREKLQKPRKSVDTWYGKWVMRPISIYITWVCVRYGLSPNQMTLISLLPGLVACFFFNYAFFGAGLFFLNLWYLLDHVDGEIARYTDKSSATGFYFDTILNFIIQPLSLYFFSLGLSRQAEGMQNAGLLAAFSSLMLMIVPMCEDAVKLALKRGTEMTDQLPSGKSAKLDKRIFTLWHTSITFPYFLLTLTLISILTAVLRQDLHYYHLYFLYYTVSSTIIWILQITYKVHSRKLDLPRHISN